MFLFVQKKRQKWTSRAILGVKSQVISGEGKREEGVFEQPRRTQISRIDDRAQLHLSETDRE